MNAIEIAGRYSWLPYTTETDATEYALHPHVDPWAYEDRLIALIDTSRRLRTPSEWKQEPST